MSADPYMERVQRRVLDENGHHDVTIEESERPDFTSRTDANGDEWERFEFTTGEDLWVSFPLYSPPVPTSEQYADAERLLRGRGPLDADAALLRCWIADTKPLAVKAGWNDDAPLIEYPTPVDWRTIVTGPDIAAASSPCPSLWQRTPEWAIWLGTGILVLALLALPVIA